MEFAQASFPRINISGWSFCTLRDSEFIEFDGGDLVHLKMSDLLAVLTEDPARNAGSFHIYIAMLVLDTPIFMAHPEG